VIEQVVQLLVGPGDQPVDRHYERYAAEQQQLLPETMLQLLKQGTAPSHASDQ
jgi:hypothetical protein